MAEVLEKVSFLEEMVQKIAYTQMQANMSLERLSREMIEFKDEMREFKDEMRIFKDEMGGFKDEMRIFKDEMGGFKDEMRDYKDWSRQQIISINRQWGDLANKMGTVVEDIVAPNMRGIARRYFGCADLDYLAIRVRKRSTTDRSRRREFDAVAACDSAFILNETKSSPELRDIDKLAAFVDSGELYDYFPEYKDFRIIPIYASLYLNEEFTAYATRRGIYALTMKDDTMAIVNFEEISTG